MDNHVDYEMDEISLLIHPQGWNEMINEEKLTSGDYVKAHSIMTGKLNDVFGINNIVITTTVPYVDSSNDPYLTVGDENVWDVKGTAQDLSLIHI